MILVTGATGKVGSETVRLLRQREVPVRALVRNPGKAAALAAAGAQLAQGDLDDPGTIDAAMPDVTCVVLVSPGVPAQELSVVRSAVRAGVKHVIKVSAAGASADAPIARRRWQAEIESGLTASGLDHTFLQPQGYMQNVLAMAPVIAKTGGIASSHGTGRAGMIDARDVAAVAAEIAASPAPHHRKTYRLSGPGLLSMAEVAAILSRVLGRPVTYRPVSTGQDKQVMVRAGLPEPVAEMNTQAFGLIAAGEAAWLTENVPSILGRPARSFEQFATDYAAAFS